MQIDVQIDVQMGVKVGVPLRAGPSASGFSLQVLAHRGSGFYAPILHAVAATLAPHTVAPATPTLLPNFSRLFNIVPILASAHVASDSRYGIRL
jgi:hypothetical protein